VIICASLSVHLVAFEAEKVYFGEFYSASSAYPPFLIGVERGVVSTCGGGVNA
jgi:hypothetical protein